MTTNRYIDNESLIDLHLSLKLTNIFCLLSTYFSHYVII